jgi:magnesium transporter
MTIRAYLYNSAGHDHEIPADEINPDGMTEETLLWVDLEDADEADTREVATLLRVMGSDRFIRGVTSREAGLQNFGHYLSACVILPSSPGQNSGKSQHRATDGEDRMMFLISERWLLTAHAGPAPLLEQFRDRDSAETMIGALSPASLAAALIDWHLGLFFDGVSAIAMEVDALDERVLRDKANKSMLGRIVMLRRKTSRLRVALVANRPVFYGLSRPDCSIVSQSDAAPHYLMLAARFDRALDEIERVRDLISGSFDLFASRSSLQTNMLVKTLTVITAIIGYIGAVAGVFSMNMKAPLLDGGNIEFWTVIVFLAGTTISALVLARFRRWI